MLSMGRDGLCWSRLRFGDVEGMEIVPEMCVTVVEYASRLVVSDGEWDWLAIAVGVQVGEEMMESYDAKRHSVPDLCGRDDWWSVCGVVTLY
jgi:hypothetical protein